MMKYAVRSSTTAHMHTIAYVSTPPWVLTWSHRESVSWLVSAERFMNALPFDSVSYVG